MIPQEKVEAHASRIFRSSSDLEDLISREVDAVVMNSLTFLTKDLHISDGIVARSPDNSRKILEVGNIFRRLLGASSYYPILLEFVVGLVGQVDEFGEFYGEMRAKLDLPSVALTDDDREVLSNQGKATMEVLEGRVALVDFELRQFFVRFLGGSELGKLVVGASNIMRKVSKVGPTAVDQSMLFFRTVGDLAYSHVESLGKSLLYSYVGRKSMKSRDFCALLLRGRLHSKKEIASMDNGQGSGVFSNCGGYGCGHFWEVAGVAQ